MSEGEGDWTDQDCLLVGFKTQMQWRYLCRVVVEI